MMDIRNPRKREIMHTPKEYVIVAVIAAVFGLAGGFIGPSMRPNSGVRPAYFAATKADFGQLSGADFFSYSGEIKHLKATVVDLSDGQRQAHLRLSGQQIAFLDSYDKERIVLSFDERSISTFTFNDVFGQPKFSIFLYNERPGPPTVAIYGHEGRVVWEKP